MKIGSQHVYKIWRSLVEYRNCVEAPVSASTDYMYAVVPACVGDAAVIVSPDPQPAVLVSTAGGDMQMQLSRQKVLLKDEHNYC